MDQLYLHIGSKIRELRKDYGGRGISQVELAAAVNTTTNTISRWETAAYKPSAMDLHTLAKYFGISISVFFPETEDSRIQALLSATGNLGDDDFDELAEYARFRVARRNLSKPN